MSSPLLKPMQVGALTLENRVWMAPLTRMRATSPGDIPNDLMREYYRQRAGAGLVVSEGTQISPQGKGYMDTPGIHSPEQVTGWRRITDAVHEAGGLMAAQLWHVGRVSHESFHDGGLPVSASALPYRNRTTIKGEDGRPQRADCPTPHALTAQEIRGVVDDYRSATRNARAAGFDLVEIHAAHGYLLQQFMSPDSNDRTDEYGGSLENRTRLTLEVVEAAAEEWGPDRVGVRISPLGAFNGLEDPAGVETGLHLAARLADRDIAFLHVSEPDWAGGAPYTDAFREQLRAAFPGPLAGAGAYDVAKAERLLEAGLVDAVAFGRSFIANPDLPERIRSGGPYNEADKNTFYGGGAQGYVDYPALHT